MRTFMSFILFLGLFAFSAILPAAGQQPSQSSSPPRAASTDENNYCQTVYADLAAQLYAEATAAAERLAEAAQRFLNQPDEASLAQARYAWLNAHAAYQRTRVFAFPGSPIWGRLIYIDPHPILESSIEDIAKQQGLLFNTDLSLDYEALIARKDPLGLFSPTTGWQVIAFLLWGDSNGQMGPGIRAASDYLPGDPLRERRRHYLQQLTFHLKQELEAVAAEWAKRSEAGIPAPFLGKSPDEVRAVIMEGIQFTLNLHIVAEGLEAVLQETPRPALSRFSASGYEDLQNAYAGIVRVVVMPDLARRFPVRGSTGNPASYCFAPLNPDTIDLIHSGAIQLAALDRPLAALATLSPDAPAREKAYMALETMEVLSSDLVRLP